MILDGFNNQPVDKIISVAGPAGPPGLSGITQNLRRPQRNTLAAIGDSMVANGPGIIAPFQSQITYKFLQQLSVLTHQRVRWCGGMFGVFGSSVASQQSTQLPNVLAMNPLPGACLLACNAAEIVNNVSYDFNTNVGLLKTMVASLLAVGVVPILWAVPPIRTSAYPVNVATINVRLNQWNVWIRRYAALNGFALIDGHTVLSQIDGTHVSGTTDDLLHPNGKGHTLIAQQALADGIAEIFPPNSIVNTARTTDDLTNLFNNGTLNYGLFTTDSNSDGIADGLSATGTATYSLVSAASTDQLQGSWQQISVSAGNSASLVASITSGWSVGDTIAFSCRVQTQNMVASSGLYNLGIRTSFPGSTTLSDGSVVTVLWNGINQWQSADVADGEVYVEFTIQPTTSALQFWGWIPSVTSGTATLRFGEVTIRNLTTGGMLQ